MSDLAILLLKAIAGKDIELTRYADLFNENEALNEPQETAEQVISKFDRLRRK